MSEAATLNPEAVEEVGARGAAVGEEPAAVFLELPAPPSVNAMFRNVKGVGRVRTKLYDDWRGHAGWRLREQRPATIHGPVLIVFNVERTNVFADIDNRVKATLDLLVQHKVIDDDRHVLGIAVAWAPPRDALMFIAVLRAAPLSIQFQLASNGAQGGWFIDAPQQEQEHEHHARISQEGEG